MTRIDPFCREGNLNRGIELPDGIAFRWIDCFRNSIHFAKLNQAYTTAIKIENNKHRFQLGDKSFPEQVEVYNSSLAGQIEKDPHRFDFVYTFKDVEQRIAELCLKWLQFNIEYREAIGCYTSTVYGNLSSPLALRWGTPRFTQRFQRMEMAWSSP